MRERDVGALVHYPIPVHLQPAYKGRVPTGPMTHTERAAQNVISLPIYPELSELHQQHVIDTVKRFFFLQLDGTTAPV
jgi:dTDP-4-amino-4,6-dideoxygalactose transaminase